MPPVRGGGSKLMSRVRTKLGELATSRHCFFSTRLSSFRRLWKIQYPTATLRRSVAADLVPVL